MVNSKQSETVETVVKRKRGRPCKNIVKDVEKHIEDFDYCKLSDDSGIIPTSEYDVCEELKLMGTYI
jgi:hypothetical protein